MKLSVVVPTYNRASAIAATLRALCQQTLSPEEFEIIVVDDGSVDDTESVVRGVMDEHPQLQWQYIRHSPNRGRSEARNSGIKAARHEIVVFIDDDIRPVPGWAAAHLAAHRQDGKPVCVTGSVVYPEEWCAQSNYIRYLNSRYLENRVLPRLPNGGLPPNWFAGGNTSVPRDLLLKIGLFNAKLDRGEDCDVGYRLFRLGIPLRYEQQAKAIHYSEVVGSVSNGIRVFKKFYQFDAPVLMRLHPEYLERFGYWIVEPPYPGKEAVRRTVIKTLIRLLAIRPLGFWLLRLLEKNDRSPRWYWPKAYQYIMLCEAVDGVKHRVSLPAAVSTTDVIL